MQFTEKDRPTFTEGDLVIGIGADSGVVRYGTFLGYGSDNTAYLMGSRTGVNIVVRADSLTYRFDHVAKPPKSPRAELLDEATKLVHSDRNATYGEPTQNFSDTAALWNVQFAHKLKESLTASDVAQAMISLKLARIKAANKRDNWVDIAGYAACGWECVESGDDE